MNCEKSLIAKGAKCELARRHFYDFCQIIAPEFYRDDYTHLKYICNEMQEFLQSDDEVMIVNAPPRHGKSRTSTLFCDWVFGQNPATKIMIGSYNETLSETFSKQVRNLIDTDRMDEQVIVYKDIFPSIEIAAGDGAVKRWSLYGQHASYLATSPTGTATGFGANLLIIDDLIKSALEANNALVLDKHWDWFVNTMLSRLEEGGKIIIIMTRWHSKDLAGRALEHFAEQGSKIRLLSMEASNDDGTMLCEGILSRKSYENKVALMGSDIASANYQQKPIDIKGKLYSNFKTYDKLPTDEKGNSLFCGIQAYCDTADEGRDRLCNIIYGVFNHEAYVLDVYYTKDGMEITEPETARRMKEYDVNVAKIESNNGGRGFARTIERLSKDIRNYKTVIKWFHQSKNKQARIMTNATWVMEHCYYPTNWRDKWPEYYKDMNEYQREGKNAHDDASDATTGVAEMCGEKHIGVVTVNI